MRNDYEQLFTHLPPPEPPDGLLVKIMRQIYREQRLMIVKRRLTLLAVVLVGSAVALVPAFRLMKTNLAESGFTQFVSLAFSDSAAILAYWKSFAWALLESLPIMGVVAFLGATLIFAASLKLLIQNIKAILAPFNSKQTMRSSKN